MSTSTKKRALTPRQYEVMRAIVTHWGRHGCAPTVRGLCVLMGWKSPNAATNALWLLHEKGWIVWGRDEGDSTARNIVVPELLEAAAVAAERFLGELT